MKKTILITAVLSVVALAQASAQQSYSFYVERRIPINWRPDNTDLQRYTVAVNPLHLINNGMKFDFEYELRKPGEWVQVSLMTYIAPHRERRYWWGYDNNNRNSYNSSFDYYHKMWGIGTSALFKKIWHRRGWYFSTGLVLEYYRVGRMDSGYVQYKEDGLTFYRMDDYLKMMSFVKPAAQINIGKHMSISRRCFFDLFIGLSASYSIYNKDKYFWNEDYGYYDYDYQNMFGFARRGINVNGGFRFGVLLWDKVRNEEL